MTAQTLTAEEAAPHYTEEQMEALRDFFTQEEIAKRIELKLPYPFE
jgi:hypothetical protein